jgi:hypothetical protein
MVWGCIQDRGGTENGCGAREGKCRGGVGGIYGASPIEVDGILEREL